MTDTEARLRQLEALLLGHPEITEADRRHPTSGCWFCGVAVATEADHEGRCWFPPSPNEPESACLACVLDTHEFGFIDSAARTDREHRDLVVTRLLGRTGWEPGVANMAEWRWFHELTKPEPHPVDRFAWVDLDQLRHVVDPPQHVCDERCPPEHRTVANLRASQRSARVSISIYGPDGRARTGGQARFIDGPNTGKPARFDTIIGSWVLAE